MVHETPKKTKQVTFDIINHLAIILQIFKLDGSSHVHMLHLDLENFLPNVI
jgi:hypothetical protein